MPSEFRNRFVERFGEDNAALAESAAEDHLSCRTFDHERGKGSDEFRWAVLMVISFECISRFADSHGFTCDWSAVDAWLKEPEQRAWLAEHDGDIDALALFGGAYNQYMPEKTEESSNV